MKKQTKNKIYLILGLLPYALCILYLLYSMIFGFYYCSGFFQSAHYEKIYGFEAAYAVFQFLYLYFLLFWYIFIPVILLTIFFIHKGLNKK